jgi:hypothetical protein
MKRQPSLSTVVWAPCTRRVSPVTPSRIDSPGPDCDGDFFCTVWHFAAPINAVRLPAYPDCPAWGVRMRVIGRREELDRVAETARAPRESALLILGEPGSGKSWLLEQAQVSASIRSVLVRAMPAERFWPLSGLARVFAFVPEVDVRSLGAASWRGSAPRTSVAAVGAGYGHQFDDGVPDLGVDVHDGADRFSAARQLLSAWTMKASSCSDTWLRDSRERACAWSQQPPASRHQARSAHSAGSRSVRCQHPKVARSPLWHWAPIVIPALHGC